MLKKILFYPDPILRKKAKDVEEIKSETKKFCADLAETMVKKDGIGLAAPQIGASERIIAVGLGEKVMVLINPKIIYKSREEEKGEEGCLSFPGIFLEIKRAQKIKVKFLNLAGEEKELEAEGLGARVFQHEIDHLDGILFIDRIGFYKKIKVRKALKQLREEYESN